jgi:hypothetical protein
MKNSSDSTFRVDIGILHVESLPASLFDDFHGAVADDDLCLIIESREETFYAGLEWLVPTAVVVFITHSYFDGIFKEMGKDHYSLLKTGLKSLWKRLLGPSAPKMVVMSSAGKSSANQPYSLVYSIGADVAPHLRFKLLFPIDITESEYEETLFAFLEFLKNFHGQTLDIRTIEQLKNAPIFSGTMLFVYDKGTASLRVLDPSSKNTER